MIILRIQARVHRALQLQQIHDAELREREREGSRVSKVVAAGDWVSAFAEAAERNVRANHDDLVVLARHHLFSLFTEFGLLINLLSGLSGRTIDRLVTEYRDSSIWIFRRLIRPI